MMAGPLVGGERGISGGFAVIGGIVVLVGTQWLLGKLLPESIASTIAWAALVTFGVTVWKFNRGMRRKRHGALARQTRAARPVPAR